MSKLTQALIPGYGANPTKPNSNPLKGLAPDLETGLPQGLPSGVGKAALKFSNPVGGIAPDINGDIGYRKGWLDTSSNGTPDAPAAGPQHSLWGDPDLTKRGWGWGMNAQGKLYEGDHNVPWGGAQGSTSTNATPTAMGPQAMPTGATQATGQGQTNLGQLGRSIAGGLGGGGLGGLAGFGRSLATGMRQFNANGGLNGTPTPAPGGPMAGPQGMPQGAGTGPNGQTPAWAPASQGGQGMPATPQNPQAMAQLVAQMRQGGQPQQIA